MFDRLNILIGKEKLEKIKKSHVLLVGLGGVGSYVFEALVRSGIGKITIIDYDTIDISNLNRQLITNIDNVGKYKVDEAIKRAKSINKDIIVIKMSIKLDENNIDKILNDKYDFIIDACDSVKAKIGLINYAKEYSIRIICSMGTANKMHPELLKISTLNKTKYDPLARILRRQFKNDKIPVVYSEETPIKSNENVLGSISFVPGTAGLLIASYVINELIK